MFNETAIITGASRGIGKATTLLLSKEKINIIACYRNNSEGMNEVVDKVLESGGKIHVVKSDLNDLESCSKIVNAAISQFGGINFLINNASDYERLKWNEIDENDFIKTLKVNLIAPFLLSQKAYPYLKKSGKGKIINISSFVALKGHSHSAHYVSAKAGLVGLSKSLALEFAPYVNVNCILPGYIRTTQINKMDEAQIDIKKKSIPLNRIGSPEEVASLISFLISEKSNYITGEVIKISGGM